MPTTSALVIGGSLAGMCAARVLSDVVDRVTIKARDARVEALKAELLRLEREAGNLVRFLRGGESSTVREELATIESALQGLRVELATLQAVERRVVPSVSRARIQARVDELAALIATDPVRARTEIRKHFEGDLELVPLPSEGPGRRVELRGRLKHASLLIPTGQEAGSPTIGCGGTLCPAGKPDPPLPRRGCRPSRAPAAHRSLTHLAPVRPALRRRCPP